jgi:hypothetical protein
MDHGSNDWEDEYQFFALQGISSISTIVGSESNRPLDPDETKALEEFASSNQSVMLLTASNTRSNSGRDSPGASSIPSSEGGRSTSSRPRPRSNVDPLESMFTPAGEPITVLPFHHNHGTSVNAGPKISDAAIYGPRFCEIYQAFNKTCDPPIDPSKHLMSLCSQYLVPFCQWVRDSDEQSMWVGDMLLGHDYLRPEVRNGLVMILVYTFASIKATLQVNADMFTTLVDHEQGLGIANKFSLKIYNDPYHFLFFLKSAISGLIDAGYIQDNERQNQQKKTKVRFENQDEYVAFNQLQAGLVQMLDAGNNAEARNYVYHVTTYWQQRAKVWKGCKYTCSTCICVSLLTYIHIHMRRCSF